MCKEVKKAIPVAALHQLAGRQNCELIATRLQFSSIDAMVASNYVPVIRLSLVTVSRTTGGTLTVTSIVNSRYCYTTLEQKMRWKCTDREVTSKQQTCSHE